MVRFALLASICLESLSCSRGPEFPYQDARFSVDKRTEDLLGRMTQAEKQELMKAGWAATPAIPRLGIPSLKVGSAGVPHDLEATWNPEIVTRLGQQMAADEPAFTPLGDPWLSSRMAVAWVRGVQEVGGIAVLRNLPCGSEARAANEQELPAFRSAIEEAGLWAIDAGRCGDDSALLIDTIDRDWGFRGFFFAPGGAAPPGIDPTEQARRVLRAMLASGVFDGQAPKTDPVERKRVERIAAEQSVVLLSNEGGLLPIYAGREKSIGVTGAKEQVDAIRARAGSTPVVDSGGSVSIRFGPVIEVSDGTRKATLWGRSAVGITDVIFGDVNPSGKLPLPVNPDFPFGFGLSYTTFDWSDLRIFPATPRYGQTVQVVLKVRNTGARFGADTVELYVHQVKSSLERPPKELKAFARVELKPGETKDVAMTLDRHSMSFYDPAVKDWATEPGVFEVLLGSSSRDIRLKGSFQLFP
jgi:hypothetical protein